MWMKGENLHGAGMVEASSTLCLGANFLVVALLGYKTGFIQCD